MTLISPIQRAFGFSLLCSIIVSGCSGSGTVTELDARPSVSIGLPQILLDSSAVNQNNLRPTIKLSNGASVSMQQGTGNMWSGIINVAPASQYVATVSWVENLNGRELQLAQLTQNLEVAADGSIVRSNASEYSTDIDTDDGGKSNLEERENGTDPFNPSDDNGDSGDTTPDPTPVVADAVIPRIATSMAPLIDGENVSLDSSDNLAGEWASAIQVDNSGAPLLIDNLIVDINTEAPDGTAYRRWAAMHDGTYLYVVVIVDDNGNRHRDSDENLNQDDSLELFLDGDNSKQTQYGTDDFHRLFPAQLAGADKQSATSGDIAGPNSSSAPLSVQFATGPGIGPRGIRRTNYEQDVYELRIDLQSAGIDTDAAFGFELQINDDDEGGDADSKWAWKHPSGNGTNVDDTPSNPSLMGTLILE